MKYLRQVFVYTSFQVSERENVMREIKKRAPQLSFTDHPEEADVCLVFGSVEERELIQPAGPEIVIYDEPKKDRKKKEEGQPEKKGEKKKKRKASQAGGKPL